MSGIPNRAIVWKMTGPAGVLFPMKIELSERVISVMSTDMTHISESEACYQISISSLVNVLTAKFRRRKSINSNKLPVQSSYRSDKPSSRHSVQNNDIIDWLSYFKPLSHYLIIHNLLSCRQSWTGLEPHLPT